MLPLRVKFMGEGHVAQFRMESARAGAMLPNAQISSKGHVAHCPMESAGAGAMLPTAQRSSRGHVVEELLLRMFQQ